MPAPKKTPVKKQPVPPKKKADKFSEKFEKKPEKPPRGYEWKQVLVKKEVKDAKVGRTQNRERI